MNFGGFHTRLNMWFPVYNSVVCLQGWNESGYSPSSWNATAAPNGSWWGAALAPFDSPAQLLEAAGKAVVLGLLILATVVGERTFAILLGNNG